MAECQCQTEAAYYRKKRRTNFFRHSGITYDFLTSNSKNNTISSRLWTCRVYFFSATCSMDVQGVPFHSQQYGRSWMSPFLPPAIWKCSDTGLRDRIPECQCQRNWSWFLCPAMMIAIFNEMHGFYYEFQAILPAYLYYWITADQILSLHFLLLYF